MKAFKHHHFAIIPLLSILAMSPTMVESKFHTGRDIASIKEEVKPEVKGHPKYDAAVSKVKPEEAKADLSKEKLVEKLGEVKLKLLKEREDFKKDQSDEKLVSEQRKGIESLIVDMVLVEGSLKKLEEGKLIEETEAKTSKDVIAESKDIIEGLLTDLEANEVLVVKAKEPKKEDKPVVVVEEPKKEEPKKEEPKKDEVKPEVAKDEPKKEEAKKDEKKCEAEEQNKVLTKQVEDLMKQNQQILQSLMGVTNMMVSMYQQNQHQHQQQQNPYYQNGPGWNQSPYQYNQPQTAGNWVYYPQGFQPQQQNIFAQPQAQYGMYPDSFYMQQPQMQMQQPMQQSGWQLNADPRYTIQNQFTPGTFGGDNSNFMFNMAQSSPTGAFGQMPTANSPVMSMGSAMNQMQQMQSQMFGPRS